MSTVIDSFDSNISGWTSANPSLVTWDSQGGLGTMWLRSAGGINPEAYRTIDVSSFNNRLRINIAKLQGSHLNSGSATRFLVKILDANATEVKSEYLWPTSAPNMSANGDGTYSGYLEFDFTAPDPTETYQLYIGPWSYDIQNNTSQWINVFVDSITSEIISHESQTLPASKYRFLMTRSHDVNYTKMALTDFRMIDDSGVDVLDYAIGTNSSSNPNDTLLSYDNSKETLWTNNYEIFPGSQNGDHWFEIQFSVENFNLHRIEFYSKTEMRDWKLQTADSADNWQDVLDFTDYPQATENEWSAVFIEDQTAVYSDSSTSDFDAWDVFEETSTIYSRKQPNALNCLQFAVSPPADNFAKVGKNIQYNFIEGESYTVKFNVQRGSTGNSQAVKDSEGTHLLNIRVLEDGPTLTNANSTGWTALAESIDITWEDTFLPGNTEDYATLYLNFTANSQVSSDGSVYVYLSTGGASGTNPNYSVYFQVNSFELLASSSSVPTYSVTETANNINEGSALTIDVSTTNVADSTELYWTVESNSGDFGSSSGNFLVTGDAGSFTVTPTADNTTEGAETFTVAIRTGSITGDIVATTGTITINDESQDPVPTYSLSSNLDSADEGSTVILTLQTTHVAESTILPFTINGSGIVLEDFVNLDSLGAGEFVIDSNGDATFDLEIYSDSTTEGPETFTVVLDDHQSISVDIDINDTSTTPAVMQSPSHSTHSLNLQKDATSKTYYIGWYGECATASDFDLTTLSADDIDNVFEINSENKVINYYTPGDTFSDFNTLELGKNYGIILKSQSTGGTSVSIPGFISTNSGTTGSLLLTDNCDGSPNSTHSAPLQKDATSKTYYIGWHGECSTTSNFDLTTLSADDIDNVFEINSENKVINYYTPGDSFSDFNTLEWGKNYGIILKSQSTGGTSVSIPGFISTNSGTAGSLLLTNNCSQSSETYELIESNQYGNLVNETPNEFNNLVIQLKTGDVTAGTVVPFTISGSNITLEDFVGLSSLQGTFTVGDDGSDGNFLLSRLDLQIAADSTTEGPETFRITLDNHQTVFLDITIQDTSLSPTTSNYEITLMNNYSQSNVDEDWHKEFYLKTKDGSNLSNTNYGFKIEGVGGSNIDSSDFEGWKDWSMSTYTPFNATLDNGYFPADGTSDQEYIEIGHAEDFATEGPETYRISLIDYPDVYLDMQINDTSVSNIPGTLQIQPHFNNAGASDSATEVEPSSAGDPFYDYHYFKVTIPDWTGGSQLLTWEIISLYPGIDSADIQVNSRQSSSSGGEVTVSSDGMSGTWQTSDYNGTGFGYQEFTPIYVLHDNLNETEYNPSENFTFKVTDENGNSSTVIGRIEDPS